VSFLYSGSLWRSLYCGISSLCVGLYRWLVKVSWLGKLVSVFWWVELYSFSLECNEMSSNELWDVYGFGVTLGCLYLGAQGCVPCCWRICLVCLALELIGPCVVLGFSVGMEAFDELLWMNVPGVRSSLESGFGLKSPASDYRSYFYSSFKTSPSIQHHPPEHRHKLP